MCNNYICSKCGEVFEDFGVFYNHVRNGCYESRGILPQPVTEVSREGNINNSTHKPLRLQADQLSLQNHSSEEQLESATEDRRVALELLFKAGNEIKKTMTKFMALKRQRKGFAEGLYLHFGKEQSQTSREFVKEQLITSEKAAEARAEALAIMESELSALSTTRVVMNYYQCACEHAFGALKKEMSTLIRDVIGTRQPNENSNFESRTLKVTIYRIMISKIHMLLDLQQKTNQWHYIMSKSLDRLERLLANEIAGHVSMRAVAPSTEQEMLSADVIQEIVNMDCGERNSDSSRHV